jgi:hypothetical protein
MGQSIKKRMFKIWRRNHSNKVKNQKMIDKNIEVMRDIKASIDSDKTT